MTQRCERRSSGPVFFGFFAAWGAVVAIGLISARTRTIVIASLLTLYIPGVAIVLLSIWRSPVDRRELSRMLTDIYRAHPGTRLTGAFYPLGVVIAGAFVFAFMLYLPFLACYGAIRVLLCRALGRPLPYERSQDRRPP